MTSRLSQIAGNGVKAVPRIRIGNEEATAEPNERSGARLAEDSSTAIPKSAEIQNRYCVDLLFSFFEHQECKDCTPQDYFCFVQFS